MKESNIIRDVKDHLYLVYRQLGPVIDANERLLKALEFFEESTGSWPPIFLGKRHYEHTLREIKARREELSQAGSLLGKMKN